jgi:hypothetical protein
LSAPTEASYRIVVGIVSHHASESIAVRNIDSRFDAAVAEVEKNNKQVSVIYSTIAVDIRSTEITPRVPKCEENLEQIGIVYTTVTIHITVVGLASNLRVQ